MMAPALAEEQPTNFQLEVIAQCANSAQCERISDHPVLIDIGIVNRGHKDVECAFTFVEAMGPFTKLIDRHTGRVAQLSVSLPPALSEVTFTKLQSGNSWGTDLIIYPQDMKKLNSADIDAHITINVPGRRPETGESVRCVGSTTLGISEPT